MNPSTIFTIAGMTSIGVLGLFLASRAEDPGIQIFGLLLAGLAAFLAFWLVNRLFEPEVVAAEESD
ncbi:MAG: hypothetical protein FJX11_07490 [Alphaproteobacteria bacterium]|nr:hypothetical protein [Alphaproteobacteria bacterium]